MGPGIRLSLTLLSALAVLSPSAAIVGCTADDDSIENKACDIAKPTNEQCVAGYFCRCEDGELSKCRCLPQEGSASSALSAPQASLLAPDDDPSQRLLRRVIGAGQR